MSCENKSTRTEIISLKKPTALDKVIENVPKPKGAVPNFGLPKWKAIPLESKIPMVPGPKGAYDFSRQKLGKKLWINSPDAEFNISDPYNYEIDLQYDGFHDKHLTNFYKRPVNIQRMIKLGFVTENLNAKCTLKEYNMYRKYLKKLHNDRVKKELKKKAELYIEMKDIKLAEDDARKYLERLRKKEHVENNKEVEKVKKENWENELKSNIRKYYDKLKKIEQVRREDLRKRKTKSRDKIEKMKRIREISAKIEHQKLVKIRTDWKVKEKKRIKMRKIRLKKEKEQKDKFIQDRWNMKQQLQIHQLAREQFLNNCSFEERQKFIKEYNEKVEKERKRMLMLLENSRKFVKCYMGRYISQNKKRSCCKIPKVHQEKNKQLNFENKDTEIRENNFLKEVQNNRSDKKQMKKSKTKKLKLKGSDKKEQNKKSTSRPEPNKGIELNEGLESIISCTKLISSDDAKSKCECERVKFLERYEILK